APDPAGTLCLEVQFALIGDHRSGPGHHLAVDPDLDHLAALLLDAEAVDLGVTGVEQIALHRQCSLLWGDRGLRGAGRRTVSGCTRGWVARCPGRGLCRGARLRVAGA